MCAIPLMDSCFGMHGHTYSRRDIMSHVYLGYMHQIYVNDMYPCSRLHSCKQYVQEARDHLDQGYDAYTYLEFLSILVVETHLRKNVRKHGSILLIQMQKDSRIPRYGRHMKNRVY